MAETRYYVATQADNTKRLIEATNAAQATRYAAKKWIVSVAPASARDMAELRAVEIEKAGES